MVHLTATVIRRSRFKNLRSTIERADSGWRAHFVTGKGEEIAADFLHVDRSMTGTLRSINEGGNAQFARAGANLGHRIDRAQGV